jgi:hypothetical protein
MTEDESLLGIVVATTPSLDLTYILPAASIFGSIQGRFKDSSIDFIKNASISSKATDATVVESDPPQSPGKNDQLHSWEGEDLDKRKSDFHHATSASRIRLDDSVAEKMIHRRSNRDNECFRHLS